MKTSISERATVGIMLCGHREYWPQFPGMKEAMIEYSENFINLVRASGVNVREPVFVDTVEDAFRAGVEFKSSNIDLLFVYLTTYVASGRYVQGALAAGCPIVIVGTQNRVNYEGMDMQKLTTFGSPCPLPEAYSAFIRCGKPAAGVIFDYMEDNPRAAKEVDEWCRAANAMHAFKGTSFGYMGHSYEVGKRARTAMDRGGGQGHPGEPRGGRETGRPTTKPVDRAQRARNGALGKSDGNIETGRKRRGRIPRSSELSGLRKAHGIGGPRPHWTFKVEGEPGRLKRPVRERWINPSNRDTRRRNRLQSLR